MPAARPSLGRAWGLTVTVLCPEVPGQLFLRNSLTAAEALAKPVLLVTLRQQVLRQAGYLHHLAPRHKVKPAAGTPAHVWPQLASTVCTPVPVPVIGRVPVIQGEGQHAHLSCLEPTPLSSCGHLLTWLKTHVLLRTLHVRNAEPTASEKGLKLG